MKRIAKLFVMMCVLAASAVDSYADLVAGWDFQTTANGGTAVLVAPNTPKQFVANFGSGTLFLNGQNGASDWVSSAINPELTGFTGTAVNAGPGFATTTPSPSALALANQAANGKSAVFRFSMAGFQDLVVSYASQRTSTGFTSQAWSFSTDGANWTDHQTVTGLPAAFAAQTLSTIAGLNGATDAYLRLTVTGATAAAGNNRIDNIQFNATAVPEPTSLMLLGSVALGGIAYRRVRKRS
ncbi:MAG: PEP-CTERM sorting domain-containing protein [Pirellula sp.]